MVAQIRRFANVLYGMCIVNTMGTVMLTDNYFEPMTSKWEMPACF